MHCVQINVQEIEVWRVYFTLIQEAGYHKQTIENDERLS